MRGIESPNHRRRAEEGLAVRQVFYADGEEDSSDVVRAVLQRAGAQVTHFRHVKECLDSLTSEECHLLISNARRPAMEGMRLLAGVKRTKPSLPVVLLVDHGDIPAAVRAMKGGATDCLERPPEPGRLTCAIESAFRESVQNSVLPENPLSKAENQVLRLILQGKTTAEVAQVLRRSRRTIEVHRSHIMRKLGAYGMVDLVRTCIRMGLLGDGP